MPRVGLTVVKTSLIVGLSIRLCINALVYVVASSHHCIVFFPSASIWDGEESD